jgi:hypothetical protein
MKNNQVTFVLVGIFLLFALLGVWLGQEYNSAIRELTSDSVTYARMQNTEAFMNQLGPVLQDYSKKNPDILPLIQSATNANPAPRPATR